MSITKKELLRIVTMNTIKKKTQPVDYEFTTFFEEGFNRFFTARKRKEWVMNCFGYDCEQIEENTYRFKLLINPVMQSEYRIDNHNFKFSKKNLKIPNSNHRQTFNVVTFDMNVEDVIFYGMHECESALNYLNEYLADIMKLVDLGKIKKEDEFDFNKIFS